MYKEIFTATKTIQILKKQKMLKVCRFLIPKGYVAITLYPFIFLKNQNDRNNEILINHERIHLQQQIELLIIPFYLWYIIHFLINYFKYKNWEKAYRNIIFEKEAYNNENDLNYLKKRKRYAFITSV